MVTPAHPHRITLEELKKSKQGHIITFMLVDCNAFWQYDNVRDRRGALVVVSETQHSSCSSAQRESLMQQKEAEEAGDTSK